jgi:hypothetical protein
MTSETAPSTPRRRRSSLGVRFAIAFLLGVVLVVGAGGGALFAYGQQYSGRVLPGVRVGVTVLSGLAPEADGKALGDAYASLGTETSDFWKVVGDVTRSKGYGLGGAIINGRTQAQGALGGGICSCSTTLFNAALRAGMKMGARKNHYYHIDRYPLGLDATVFISDSGSKQTMTWTNDTKYPVLIRGINTRGSGKGYVTFKLYSVPTGRTVSISAPTIKNTRPTARSSARRPTTRTTPWSRVSC